MRHTKNFLMQLILGSVFLAGQAQAQIVDYSGLEEVFGEPVTTSATGKPQRVSQVPVSMEIISRRDIEDSGALDIPGLLRQVAGVEVQRSFAGHADVNIRGYNQAMSNRLLVLVNGRQVYQDQYGMTIWQSLPVQLNEIKQIEVIRGPNSSLYGFNAASGVVNIVTDRPLSDDNSTYQLRAGTQNYREISGVETLNFSDRFAVRLSGSGLHMDGFDRDHSFGPATRDEDALKKYGFNLDGEFTVSPETNLRFETGLGSAKLDMNLPYSIPSNVDTLNRHFGVNLSHDSGAAGVWNLRAYRNESNLKVAADSLGTTNVDPVSNRLHVLEVSNLIPLNPDHTLRLGGEYRDNEVQGALIGSGAARYEMEIAAANIMWNWQMNDQLAWTNSARVDHWQTHRHGGLNTMDPLRVVSLDGRSDTEFSFNSGLLYQADNVSSYRFSVGRGIRIPSLVELSQNGFVNNYVEAYGDPMLDPESNLTFELGYSRLLRGGENRLELFTNLYTQELHNLIGGTVYGVAFPGVGANPETSFENLGDSRAYGLEVGLKGSALANHLDWGVNYAYITVNDDEDSAWSRDYLVYGSSQPHHKVNARMHYRTGAWDMGVSGSFVSGRDDARMVVVDFFGSPSKLVDQDSYVVLNGNIGYQINDSVHLSLDGYNLVDEHEERTSYNLQPGGENFGGNQLGRTLLLTLTSRF